MKAGQKRKQARQQAARAKRRAAVRQEGNVLHVPRAAWMRNSK